MLRSLTSVYLFSLFCTLNCAKISRHYFGENGTLPKTMANLGTVNIKGWVLSVVLHRPRVWHVTREQVRGRVRGDHQPRQRGQARQRVPAARRRRRVPRRVHRRHRLRPLHVLAGAASRGIDCNIILVTFIFTTYYTALHLIILFRQHKFN